MYVYIYVGGWFIRLLRWFVLCTYMVYMAAEVTEVGTYVATVRIGLDRETNRGAGHRACWSLFVCPRSLLFGHIVLYCTSSSNVKGTVLYSVADWHGMKKSDIVHLYVCRFESFSILGHVYRGEICIIIFHTSHANLRSNMQLFSGIQYIHHVAYFSNTIPILHSLNAIIRTAYASRQWINVVAVMRGQYICTKSVPSLGVVHGFGWLYSFMKLSTVPRT